MITRTDIGMGNQLGAQMSDLANLMYVGIKNNQEVVLFKELRGFRRGYQFLEVFNIKDLRIISSCPKVIAEIVEIYCRQFQRPGTWRQKMRRIYSNKVGSLTDKIVFHMVLRCGGGGMKDLQIYKVVPARILR